MSEAFNANILSRLRKIGIEDPVELIRYLPHRYDDFTVPLKNIPAIMALGHGQGFYAKLRLEGVKTMTEINQEKQARGESPSNARVEYVQVELSDGMRKTRAVVFGRVDPWLALKKSSLNKVIHVSGRLEVKDSFRNLGQLNIVPYADQEKIVARYRGKEKVISPDRVAEVVKIALLHHVDQAAEEMLDQLNSDESVVMQHCRIPFQNLKQMLITLHNPRSREDLEKALKAARRLNAYYGLRQVMDATVRDPVPEARMELDRDLIKSLVERHPFIPTGDQRRAIWDIICDLDRETPMDRLLSADVGNGKTMSYGIPAAYASKKGRNTVVLLPTEPLAGQVAKNIKTWYPELNVHLATAGWKQAVTQGDILVGTTAVLSWLKKNPDWKVDLAIVDEQQKMGTAQRDALKSLGTHVLEATATPIPRTMAQTIFGHKKVSIIKDCPVKKDIKTHLLPNTEEGKRFAYDTMNNWLGQGKKAIVIYPLVAEQSAYYFQIQAENQKGAEKIAALIKKADLSLKWVKPVDSEDVQALSSELESAPESGFVAEFHGEEDAYKRLLKRFERYVEDQAVNIQYLGSRVDSEMIERNRNTILRAKESWEKRLPGRVGMIHGRSDRSEKAAIIDQMNQGKYDILLSTTLIEIGIDVKDACSLTVINAGLLGAYTLHQLRGRLARNGGTADFMMMTDSTLEEMDEAARERLTLLIKHTSGDEIAMHDMEQRGFGSLASGGRSQKGFEDGIFPSIKLTPSELDTFLKDMAREANRTDAEPGI